MPFPIIPLATAGIAALPGIISALRGSGNNNQQQPTSNNLTPMGNPGGQLNTVRGPNTTYTQVPRQTGQQSAVSNEALQQLLGGLQSGNTGFQPIAENARRNYQKRTVPSLVERFTAMGSGPRSSAFQNALGESAASLESNLGAQESQYNMGLYQLLSQLGMAPQFDTGEEVDQPGFGQSALNFIGNNPKALESILSLLSQYMNKGA